MGGLMFDVVALQDTTVTKVQFMFNGGFGSTETYKLYKLTATGAHGATNMFDSTKWTVVASGSALSATSGAQTATFEVAINAGSTQAFYIQGISRGLISQGLPSAGGTYKSDANIKLMAGRGLFLGSPFNNGFGSTYWCNPNMIQIMYTTPYVSTTARAPTTCKFTVDNAVTSVFYNNRDITSTVTGSLGDWSQVKSVDVVLVANAYFVVAAENFETNSNACQTGGFSITCDNGVSSNEGWEAVGDSVSVADGRKSGVGSGWSSSLCTSTSGYSLAGYSSVRKIWASSGSKGAAFRKKL
jgi:hypothetical protein